MFWSKARTLKKRLAALKDQSAQDDARRMRTAIRELDPFQREQDLQVITPFKEKKTA